MLATATSAATVIGCVTLIILLVPIYIMTLKAANSYGRLENKVDNIAQLAAQTAAAQATTNALLATAITKLTDQFTAHEVTDATHFGEIKGILGNPAQRP